MVYRQFTRNTFVLRCLMIKICLNIINKVLSKNLLIFAEIRSSPPVIWIGDSTSLSQNVSIVNNGIILHK